MGTLRGEWQRCEVLCLPRAVELMEGMWPSTPRIHSAGPSRPKELLGRAECGARSCFWGLRMLIVGGRSWLVKARKPIAGPEAGSGGGASCFWGLEADCWGQKLLVALRSCGRSLSPERSPSLCPQAASITSTTSPTPASGSGPAAAAGTAPASPARCGAPTSW